MNLGISGERIRSATQSGRGAFVGYLPVGFPDVAGSIEAMKALVEGAEGVGADIVEIGMPYSDPMMDGPTIQYATTKALEAGVRTRDIFRAVEAVATTGAVPMVMIYWNLVEQYGVDAFARDLASAGGAGLITPDLTIDEAEEWVASSELHDLDRVFLIAPSSTDERVAATMARCRGWVYATAVMGVTGVRSETSAAAPVIVSRARQADRDLPVGVGLGISTGEQAAETVAYADAAIIGSALLRPLIDGDLQGMRRLVHEIAMGVRTPC